jgi:hypothetical protein
MSDQLAIVRVSPIKSQRNSQNQTSMLGIHVRIKPRQFVNLWKITETVRCGRSLLYAPLPKNDLFLTCHEDVAIRMLKYMSDPYVSGTRESMIPVIQSSILAKRHQGVQSSATTHLHWLHSLNCSLGTKSFLSWASRF